MLGQKNIWFIWQLFKSFPNRFVIYGVTIESPIESPMVSSTILNSPGSRVQDQPYRGYLYPPKTNYIQVPMTWYDTSRWWCACSLLSRCILGIPQLDILSCLSKPPANAKEWVQIMSRGMYRKNWWKYGKITDAPLRRSRFAPRCRRRSICVQGNAAIQVPTILLEKTSSC